MTRQTYCRSPIVFICLIACGIPALVFGQQAGDAVVVTVDFKTKIRDKEVDQVYAGGVHRVVDVQEKWVALLDVRGWIPRQYVLPLDTALEQFTKRIESDPRDFDALAIRGMIHLEKGDLAAAFRDLNEALQVNNQRPVFWNNRGLVAMRANDIDRAVADLSEAIRLAPRYATAWHNRGMCHYAQGKFADALGDYNKAIEVDQSVPAFFVNRGVTQLALGQHDAAMQDFNAALEIRNNIPEAYLGRANVLLTKGDFVRAEDNASEAIRLQPGNADASSNRGWIRFKAGNRDAALADLGRAIELDRDFAKALSNRGVVLTAAGRYDEALADLDRAIALEDWSSLAWTNRGNAWLGKHEYQKALSDFEKALQLAPNDVEAMNAMAWFLATCPDGKFRDGGKALELATAACEKSGMKDWSHVDTLAAALAESGDFETAVAKQELALRGAPEAWRERCEQRLAQYRSGQPWRTDNGK